MAKRTAHGGSLPVGWLPALAAITVTGAGLAGNLVRNGVFEDGHAPFLLTFVPPAKGHVKVANGELCVTLEAAGNEGWDATLRQRAMALQKGHTYTLSFSARASRSTKLRVRLGLVGPPYDNYLQKEIAVGTTAAATQLPLTATVDDPSAELAFHLGGPLAGQVPFEVCLSKVSLEDPKYTPPPPPTKVIVPNVVVDPLGYFASGGKRAMVKSASKTGLPFEILDAKGAKVHGGTTKLFGLDPASGDTLHHADFSQFSAAAEGLTLAVGADKSAPFSVGKPYGALATDALAFFLHQRSSVEIPAILVGDKWARKAGHPSDIKVFCEPKSGCEYALDVHGGWYDAGDHGKYVVNGGIATWMMLAYYERTKHLGGVLDAIGDGKLKIPESANGVPDLLDEARFELEFLMRMQVPPGKPLAGMAHHKVHAEKWTPLGTAPDTDATPRWLHAPSTAATLNLAAVAAQCARIWKPIDAKFADQCLDAAEKAWAAALANPNKLAPPTDNVGGGAYEDGDPSDEKYWAACELFLATGKANYKDALTSSPFYKSIPGGANGPPAAMDWAKTQALGTMSLLIVPNALPKTDLDAARANLKATADGYLATIAAEGWRTPLRNGPYPWGSNSLVLDDAVVLSLAYDVFKETKYLEGVRDAASYIMGRNPMAQTYVTGYGKNPLRNPHHRFWAAQANPAFPFAPPGAVSGGPNSGLEDPLAKGLLLACPPEKCFVDHIESYATNEVAINWNAPLAWVALFLDETASKP